MKLHLKPSVLVLILVLALLTSDTLAMQKDEGLSISGPSNALHSSSSALNTPSFAVANPALFSQEELMNMKIGYSIIEDRIKQKQKILSDLTSQDRPLSLKMAICQNDFGTVLKVGPLVDSDASNKDIEYYCKYISAILHSYALSQTCAHKMFASTTPKEKEYHQNNLYYFLSFEAKIFRDVIKKRYNHEIPEHSIEDNFYEMICSKMCATATKEYDILKEYIVFESFVGGIKKQIDNGKLSDIYLEKNTALLEALKRSPISWLGAVKTSFSKIDAQIFELVNPYLESVDIKLKECGQNMLGITEVFCKQLKTYSEKYATDKDNDVITMYNICGPWILETIRAYDNIVLTIKNIEKASIEWVKKFKENQKLFNKLPQGYKNAITLYLQERDGLEQEEKKQKLTQKAAARKAKKKLKPKKGAEQKEPLASDLPKHKPVVVSIHLESQTKELTQQSSGLSMLESQKPMEAGITSSIGLGTVEFAQQSADMLISEPQKLTEAVVTSSIGSTTAKLTQRDPKIKVTIGPERSLSPAIEIKTESAPGRPRKLPEQYRRDDFTCFIKELMMEKNERSLKKLFKQLSFAFGIEAETDEQRNKGYFAVRSPITGQVHVRTYHHLHVHHPYASIFMAMHDVLVVADLLG